MGKLEELEKLKELKDKGILTEMEFEIEKHKVLNNNEETEDGDSKSSKKATAGFILGLCSMLAWLIPLIGWPVTILGIIFSSLGINSDNKGIAMAGLILSIVFLLVTTIYFITNFVSLYSLLY